MCKYITDVYFAPIEVNRDNQAVLVAGDVKHDEFADLIGRRRAAVRQGAPLTTLRQAQDKAQDKLRGAEPVNRVLSAGTARGGYGLPRPADRPLRYLSGSPTWLRPLSCRGNPNCRQESRSA